jgi:hypothetical protein
MNTNVSAVSSDYMPILHVNWVVNVVVIGLIFAGVYFFIWKNKKE